MMAVNRKRAAAIQKALRDVNPEAEIFKIQLKKEESANKVKILKK